MKKIGIIMGSDSDLPVVSKAMDTLKEFGVPFEVHVYSAHRTPVEAKAFSENAREKGAKCRSIRSKKPDSRQKTARNCFRRYCRGGDLLI